MRWIHALPALALSLGACADDDPENAPPDAGDTGPTDAEVDAGPDDAGRPDRGAVPDAGVDLGRPECDPLVPEVCALPWPSDHYLFDRPQPLPQLELALGALPVNAEQETVDPELLQVHDGYSVDSPIVLSIPNLDVEDLPNELQIEDSLAEDAPIVLLRRDGLDLVPEPHWVEVDPLASGSDPRLVFIRPARRLLPSTTYYVVLRNLRTTDGTRVPRPEAFELLLSRATEGTSLAHRQDRFDELISSVESAGIARETIQLAWGFRTISRRRLRFRLDAMRDAYDRIRRETGPVPFTVTSTTFLEPDPIRFLRFEGTMEVPDFLRPVAIGDFEGEILNAPDGFTPEPVGTRSVDFRIEVPATALNTATDPPRSIIVQVGHPFLSGADVVATDGMARLATEQRLVLGATDWPGMTRADASLHAAATRDLSRLEMVLGRLYQGFVHQWALSEILVEFLRRPSVEGSLNTETGSVYYYGLETGAALGPALLATNPRLSRAALAGGTFDPVTLAGRSQIGRSFLSGMGDDLVDAYGSPAEAWVGVLTAQMFFDYVTSSAWLGSLEPEGTEPPPRILFTAAKGDRIAPTIDLEVFARTSTYAVALMENPPGGRAVPSVVPAPYPREGSGVVTFDVGAPFAPPGIVVPTGDGPDPHEVAFELPAHRNLVRTFLATGRIEDFCGGSACEFEQ